MTNAFNIKGKTLKPSDPTLSADHRVRNGAARRDKTRQKLLSTALSVFSERGVDAPSIDDFIAAAGVSRGTFYNHFKTTRELLDAVTAEVSDEVIAAIEQVVIGIESPVERVACGCLMYMQVAVDHPAWGAFIARTGVRGVASGRLLDVYLPRDLESAREHGQMAFTSVRSARDVLLGSLFQGIESVLSGKASYEHLQSTLGMALRGIGVRKPQIQRLMVMPAVKIDAPAVLLLLEPDADRVQSATQHLPPNLYDTAS
jgi:AcrR family transcriptional regulator